MRQGTGILFVIDDLGLFALIKMVLSGTLLVLMVSMFFNKFWW